MTTPSDAPPPYAMPTAVGRAARIALLVLGVLAGAAVGVVGSFLHRAEFSAGGTGIPDGLLLSLGGLAGLLLLIGELAPVLAPARAPYPGRLGLLGAAAAGWVLAVIWLTYIGPPFSFQDKGDVVLANDWLSMTYLIAGMAIATALLYKAWIAVLDAKLARARG